MDEKALENTSPDFDKNSKTQKVALPKQLVKDIPLPSTMEEVLSTEHPYVRRGEQIILTSKWPNSCCNHCHGTGILCLRTEKPPPIPKPQLNKPCPCGSGKKYKKCCKNTVEKLKQSYFTVMMCKCVGRAANLSHPISGKDKEVIEQALKEEI